MQILPRSLAQRIRVSVLLALTLSLLWFTHARALVYYVLYQPREGDVIFQSLPMYDLVKAIEGATHSPYSHCGVVLKNGQGAWVVIQALQTVHETPLLLFMLQGRYGEVAVYRLDTKYDAVLPSFKAGLRTYLGKPYDFDYKMDDNAIYCSELVYKGFRQATGENLGQLQRLGDLDWKPFRTIILLDQHGDLPLDREMITPVAMSRAPQLHRVFSGGL